MTNASFIFIEQIDRLRNYIAQNASWPSSETGFAAYVLGDDEGLPILPSQAMVDLGKLDQGPFLSSMGYAFTCQTLPSQEVSDRWSEGFGRLIGRDAFPADRQSFFYRPTDLVGITLGAIATKNVSTTLMRVLTDGQAKVNADDFWSFVLSIHAATQIGINWSTTTLPNIQSMSLSDLCLLHWYHHNQASVSLLSENQVPELEHRILDLASTNKIEPEDIAKAAVVFSSLKKIVRKFVQSVYEEHWKNGRDQKDSIKLISELCHRFPLFARQLANRSHKREPVLIQDEYDVQYALYALLCLHFDDVRPEEWTPSYAGNASRVDFLLKDQKIVIEAKMTRKSLDQKAVTNELIIDTKRYKTHPDCQHLICFVYDPSNKITNPAALEKDVAEHDTTPSVSVVVSPR